MYQQLNCKEILDSLTYYKQVSRLGHLHGDLHSHLHGRIIKLACTQLIYELVHPYINWVSTRFRLGANLVLS